MAQAIVILFSPILARIYSPADYGVVALYSSILGISGSVSALCYHIAIPLPKEKKFVLSLVLLSLGIQAILSFGLFLLTFLRGDTILAFLNAQSLIPYKWLVPVGFLGLGVYQILNYWGLKEKAFKEIAQTKLAQTATSVTVNISLGLLGFRPLGLLLGHLASQAGGILSLGLRLGKPNSKEARNVSKEDVFFVARRYKIFPLYRIWSGLLNTLSIQITPLVLVSLFDTQIVGWYSFSLRLLQLPMVLIGQSIGQVFFQRASEALHKGTLSNLVFRTFRSLVLVATFPIVSLAIMAPQLFGFVFGETWVVSGVYSRFLAPWLLANFCFSAISNIFAVLEKQRLALGFQLVLFSARIFSLFLASYFPGAEAPIAFYGFASFVIYLFAIALEMKITKNSIATSMGFLFGEMFVCILFLIPLLLGVYAELHFMLLFCIAGICYGAYMLTLVKVRKILVFPPLRER